MTAVKVAIAPQSDDGIERAIEAGGGEVVDLSSADALVWTNPRDPETLKNLLRKHSLRWVQLPFAGIERFFDAGVIDDERLWTCTKGAYGHTTAEHALTLMLVAARRVHVHVRGRKWVRADLGAPERTLEGATAVVVGTGGIGTALTRMLQPLRMRVIGVNRSGAPLDGAERTVAVAELPSVLADADYVVLAAAHTPETHHLLDAAMLGRMKPEAWIVNVARGALIDTAALVGALEAGSIAGAALDVTDPEPLPEGHRLWDLDNAVITPHIANTWDMALPALRAVVERNVAHFAAGDDLEGVVDPSLGY